MKSGVLPAEQGRALAKVLKVRLLADYTSETPLLDEAGETVALAEAFVAAVRARFSD